MTYASWSGIKTLEKGSLNFFYGDPQIWQSTHQNTFPPNRTRADTPRRDFLLKCGLYIRIWINYDPCFSEAKQMYSTIWGKWTV
jgi:hypothetical protein